MTIMELKQKYNEQIIERAATEIVVAGLSRISAEGGEHATPLAAEIHRCFEDINNSSWNDIRAIIKRSL